MGKVFFDSGISLDGFFAGDSRSPQNPLGDRGPTIHNWMFQQKAFWQHMNMEGGEEDSADGEFIRASIARTGAYVMGKRMFEEGEVHWPEDLFKADLFVLTHEKRAPWVQKGGTTFYFVNDGIESALKKAKASAKGKDVRLQGGAHMIRQYLNAGLVDEFIIHIAPIILGSGIRLFDQIDRDRFNLDIMESSSSPLVTHIRYKLTNKG